METEKLDRILDGLGVFIINVLLILLIIGVILRYVFNAYFPIAGEVPVNLFPILPLLLVGILWKRKNIISLDAIYTHLGPKPKYVFDVIFGVAGVAVASIWAVGSVQTVLFDLKYSQLTMEMFVNFAYYHAPFALCIFIFAFYVIVDLIKLITHRGLKES